MTGGAHPSSYALDRGDPDARAHVLACADCRERAAAALAMDHAFADEVVPRTLGRVRARLEGPRPRPWRSLFLACAGVAAAAAIVVTVRPRAERDAPAYAGLKGDAALPFSIFVKRGADVWAMEPGQKLRAGDALRFVARVTRPRYLELRARDGAGREHTLFPAGPRAALVQPGEALPGGFVVDAAPGPERLVALVADHAFAIGQQSGSDVDVQRLELPKEP